MKTSTTLEKRIRGGNFVVVPRKEYEQFSTWKKTVRVQLDEQWFWTPEWQRKEALADKAIRSKKVSGLFTTHKKLIAELKKKHK